MDLLLRKECRFRSVATPVATNGRPHGSADATGRRIIVRTGVRTLRIAAALGGHTIVLTGWLGAGMIKQILFEFFPLGSIEVQSG